jgi:hypothetical protein
LDLVGLSRVSAAPGLQPSCPVARIFRSTYTLAEWVNQWYPALDLERTTLANYRYMIEVHILPTFGERAVTSITAEQVSSWERQIAESGYARRTAKDARATLTTILGEAIPRHIQVNPAQRRRGKGRKGQRRIERNEKAEKAAGRRRRRAQKSGGSLRGIGAAACRRHSARFVASTSLQPDAARLEARASDLDGRGRRT